MKPRDIFILVLRILLLTAGMFVMALGIADVTLAGLGTTPISTVPLVTAEILGITFGEATFVVNCFFVLGQIVLLRRGYQLVNLLQIPLVFAFGFFITLYVFYDNCLCNKSGTVHSFHTAKAQWYILAF